MRYNSNKKINTLSYDYYRERGLSREAYMKDALERLERLKYILFRLDTERPSARVCHEWNVCRNMLADELNEFNKIYKRAINTKSTGKILENLSIVMYSSEMVGNRCLCVLGNDSYYRKLKDAYIVSEENCIKRNYETFEGKYIKK